MLPPKVSLPAEQQHLLKLFRELSATDRDQLLAFAEFLVYRATDDERAGIADAPVEPALPQDIPRPPSESVIAAIRRLSKTFPMLDKDPLLHETSALMSAHVLQGRSAVDVIDELEILFRQHYERVQSGDE